MSDRDKNASGPLSAWMKFVSAIGVPSFLVLYLLGAIPFLPSPLLKQQDALAAHAVETKELARVFRVICHAVTKDDDILRALCGALIRPDGGG